MIIVENSGHFIFGEQPEVCMLLFGLISLKFKQEPVRFMHLKIYLCELEYSFIVVLPHAQCQVISTLIIDFLLENLNKFFHWFAGKFHGLHMWH